MSNKYELHSRGDKLHILLKKGESIKDAILREFGWLINPILKETNSFQESLDKLGWKIKNNENNSDPRCPSEDRISGKSFE